jgi:molybdopterin converting factor subunit 1
MAEAVTLTVLYFASARDLAGTSEEKLVFSEQVGTLRELTAHLAARHPALRGAIERMRVARNEAFAELDERPVDGDVIALIPPVSGG